MMVVRALVRAVELAGVERSRFLTEAKLASLPLANIQARVPRDLYLQALDVAFSLTRDPALGLHLGESFSFDSFDVIGLLASHSASLRDALRAAANYGRIVNDGHQLELHELGDTATLRLAPGRDAAPLTQFSAEFCLVGLLRLLRFFMGEDLPARRVSLAYAAPAHHGEYTRIFQGRECFSQPFNEIEFDSAWLERQHGMLSTELRSVLQSRADLLLAKVDHDASIGKRVRLWLAAQISPERPTMDAVARGLGMSGRSLRRRMRAECVDYTDLVEDALADRAKRLLSDPQKSIEATAYEMGFATHAAFSRAFKRWTGMAPSDFRSAT